jgi:hypothetical protein
MTSDKANLWVDMISPMAEKYGDIIARYHRKGHLAHVEIISGKLNKLQIVVDDGDRDEIRVYSYDKPYYDVRHIARVDMPLCDPSFDPAEIIATIERTLIEIKNA